jgi:hypothetical protein
VTDAASALTGTVSGAVAAGPAAALAITGTPATIPSGETFSATVGALDACGNAVAAYQGTVALTSTDPAAAALASHDVMGSYQFGGLKLKTVGAQTISASDGALTGMAVVTVRPTGIAWGVTAGCPTCSVEPFQLQTMVDNSTVIVGLFDNMGSGALDQPVFGPGEANQTTLTPPSVSGEIWMARFDAMGTLAWAKRAGGNGYDDANGVRLLPDGSFLVTGEVTTSAVDGGGNVVFGPGETNQTSVTSAASQLWYLARYNTADGTLISVQTNGGTAQAERAEGDSIALYPDGSFTVCGTVAGRATFGMGGPHETALDATAVSRGFVLAHYDASATLAWAKLYMGVGSNDQLYAQRCQETSDGGLIAVGSVAGTAVIGAKTLTALGQQDFWIARFDSNGDPVWTKSAGVTAMTTANNRSAWAGGLAIDADGAAYVGGAFSNQSTSGASITFDSSKLITASYSGAAFLLSYSADGRLAWAKLLDANAEFSSVNVSDVVLSGGRVVATGTYYGGAVFGPGEAGQTTLVRMSSNDAADEYLAAFDTLTGDVQWAHRAAVAGSASAFFSGSSMALGVRPDGQLVAAGLFVGTGAFGPDDATPISMSASNYNLFIAAFWPY